MSSHPVIRRSLFVPLLSRLLTAAAAVVSFTIFAASATAADRPNVVFILVDDLGYMDIGAYNPDTFYETPNVDRLAAMSLRFTDGYAANPVCSPTRYSVMTDRYPTRVDATNFICFMSDNGGLSTSEGSPTSNLPLRGGKGWLYEGGIREPFMIHAPGVTSPGSVCRVPVTSTDFYPTLLNLIDADPRPEQHLDGRDLTPLLRGADSLDRDALYWHYPHYSNQGGFPGAAIRMGDWKLIERFEDVGRRCDRVTIPRDPHPRTRCERARHRWERESRRIGFRVVSRHSPRGRCPRPFGRQHSALAFLRRS